MVFLEYSNRRPAKQKKCAEREKRTKKNWKSANAKFHAIMKNFYLKYENTSYKCITLHLFKFLNLMFYFQMGYWYRFSTIHASACVRLLLLGNYWRNWFWLCDWSPNAKPPASKEGDAHFGRLKDWHTVPFPFHGRWAASFGAHDERPRPSFLHFTNHECTRPSPSKDHARINLLSICSSR